MTFALLVGQNRRTGRLTSRRRCAWIFVAAAVWFLIVVTRAALWIDTTAWVPPLGLHQTQSHDLEAVDAVNDGDAASSRRSALGAAALGGAALPAAGPQQLAVALSSTQDEKAATNVFKEATPGVVSIARRLQQQGAPRDEDGLPKAIGSGFVWDKTHVVTNNHVVKDMKDEQILIIFSGARKPSKVKTKIVLPSEEPQEREVLQGRVIGADAALDVAVIKVIPFVGENMTDIMQPLQRGSSFDLEVGQTVYAVGNPFGLEHSMSKGIISGLARTFNEGGRPIRDCIQTDATINPGNSGGPLLDSSGRVIGVNTAIITGVTGTWAGVGLATPMDTVSKNVVAIIEKGFVNRAFLGITFARDIVSEQLRLPGVIVVAVTPGSPADKAGVQPMRNGVLGDVVVAVDGKAVRTGGDFFRLLDKHVPEDLVTFVVQRKSKGVDDAVDRVLLNATLSSTRD